MADSKVQRVFPKVYPGMSTRPGDGSDVIPEAGDTIVGPGSAVPKFDQNQPDGADSSYNGDAFCCPTALAMISSWEGNQGKLTDAQLIQRVAKEAGTDEVHGTAPQGLREGAAGEGMSALTKYGKLNFTWIKQQLAKNRVVVLRGDFYAMPPHQDLTKYAAHYIDITGYDQTKGVYLVNDPADTDIQTESAANLNTFVTHHANYSPTGGAYMFSVGND